MSKPTVDPKLLDILVCPLTKGPLRYDAENQELVSEQAGLCYPIRDGIPIMLVDEARPIDGPKPGGEKPGGEKPGAEKLGAEKLGAEKLGAEKLGE